MRAPAGRSSFPHLDGVRGIAALAILGYHAVGGNYRSITGWVEFGTALRSALPFFFFLSAFLLYWPYVVARLGGGTRPRLKTSWWRRFLRIVPAYWVALTLIGYLYRGPVLNELRSLGVRLGTHGAAHLRLAVGGDDPDRDRPRKRQLLPARASADALGPIVSALAGRGFPSLCPT